MIISSQKSKTGTKKNMSPYETCTALAIVCGFLFVLALSQPSHVGFLLCDGGLSIALNASEQWHPSMGLQLPRLSHSIAQLPSRHNPLPTNLPQSIYPF